MIPISIRMIVIVLIAMLEELVSKKDTAEKKRILANVTQEQIISYGFTEAEYAKTENSV